uniref:Yippee domain-containing protein n=1 Tax=Plectus sambesii TaxID=2011161 RepID=A0A914XEG4_9BILA
MGRLFLEHLGGTRLFSCANCDTFLTNRGELVSTRFTGATGRAFLFDKVVNLEYSEVQDRIMLTGRHMVRDVSCKRCKTKLGWMYEFATDESQKYKEGRVILERALVTESEGFEEHSNDDYSANHPPQQQQQHAHHHQPPLPPPNIPPPAAVMAFGNLQHLQQHQAYLAAFGHGVPPL